MSKRPEEETASARYWRDREDEALKHYITDEQEYQRRLTRIYTNMLDGVQNEINAFYGRYASKEGITIAEARRRVSQADIAAYERKAARYVAERNFSPQANEEMRLYNLMMKVNRLEMLKANIGLELIAGHDELETFMEGILRGRTMEELERQAGILGKTIHNNAKRADAIVNASFQNATFSDRIWMYQDMLRADLSTLLQSGLIQGKNPRELAKKLEQRFNVSASNAERLMRTELARVQTEAQKQSFKRNGFTMYQFICNHNGNTCSICQGLNGQHFKVEDMLPAENAPPMHPNCRCSTAAYEDSAEYDAWLDYLSNGGTTEEWNATGKKAWEASRAAGETSRRAAQPQNNTTRPRIEQTTENAVSKATPRTQPRTATKKNTNAARVYARKDLEQMSLAHIRKIAEDLAVEYYKSGASGISFTSTSVETVAKALAAQGSKTSLIKDIMSMQRRIKTHNEKR